MTTQLSKAQIEALKVELAKYGLNVSVARKPKPAEQSYIARIKAWKPETAAGRACRSNMLWLASLPPVKGVSNFKVRDICGKWLSPGEPGFEEAKQYQQLAWARPYSLLYAPEYPWAPFRGNEPR